MPECSTCEGTGLHPCPPSGDTQLTWVCPRCGGAGRIHTYSHKPIYSTGPMFSDLHEQTDEQVLEKLYYGDTDTNCL